MYVPNHWCDATFGYRVESDRSSRMSQHCFMHNFQVLQVTAQLQEDHPPCQRQCNCQWTFLLHSVRDSKANICEQINRSLQFDSTARTPQSFLSFQSSLPQHLCRIYMHTPPEFQGKPSYDWIKALTPGTSSLPFAPLFRLPSPRSTSSGSTLTFHPNILPMSVKPSCCLKDTVKKAICTKRQSVTR